MNAEDRVRARSVSARPAADGRYYDVVNAAIADRDELLAVANEVLDIYDRQPRDWGLLLHDALERLRLIAWVDDRDPIERYGTLEHEAWLIEQEQRDG